jgi:hypothetical protein
MPDLTLTQFLWLMVATQLVIFASMWFFAATMKSSYEPAMRMFGLFNFFLGADTLLVALRGTAVPEWLTRPGANLVGLIGFVALWAGGGRLFKPGHSLTEPLLVMAASATAIIGFSLFPGYGSLRVASEFLAIAWMLVRTAAFVVPVLRERYGALPANATLILAWIASAGVFVRAMGAIALGWQIEVESDGPENLAFAYFVLAGVTCVNSLLAYVLLSSILSAIHSMARHDPLTGLLNRRAFDQQ